MSKWGQRDVASGFATGGAILAVQFRGQAVERAGAHVLGSSGRIWCAGGWRAALRRGTWNEQTDGVI